MQEPKFYLTKQGLERIQKEHAKLLDFKKQKVKGEVPSILHSEEVNPEYLSFQEDMGLLNARLAGYGNILKNAEPIRIPPKQERGRVHLGATVTLELDGEIDKFTIVGTIEADPAQKKISNESPIGKALTGTKVGQAVVVKASVVNHTCKVLKISYNKL